MTVDPRLQLTPGEYLIHPDGSASKVVDKQSMTVDEILTHGLYVDRRGLEWASLGSAWVLVYTTRWANKPKRESMTANEMRLLIVRDMHRDECFGLDNCTSHPVWIVSQCYNEDGAMGWEILGPYKNQGRLLDAPHPEAMNAAYRLAVEE